MSSPRNPPHAKSGTPSANPGLNKPRLKTQTATVKTLAADPKGIPKTLATSPSADTPPLCAVHEHQAVVLFCATCNVPVCRRCVASPNHLSHQFLDFKDAYEAHNTQTAIAAADDWADRVGATLPRVDATLLALNEQLVELETAIRAKSDEDRQYYATLVDRREQALTQRARDMIQKKREKLNKQASMLTSHLHLMGTSLSCWFQQNLSLAAVLIKNFWSQKRTVTSYDGKPMRATMHAP